MNRVSPSQRSTQRSSQRSTQRRNKKPSSLLLGDRAVDIARAALEELGDGEVGRHTGVHGVSSTVATHRFAADVPGYSGWEWHAVLACAPGSDEVTVSEVALVPAPGGDALRAPDWVPWAERVRPGDLEPGMLLPPEPGDPRLAPTGEEGTGPKQLTAAGVAETKTRWRKGDFGPNSEFAEKAALECKTCAFFVPLSEPVGASFGACTNKFSADARVVHAAYGCGAHSETPASRNSDEPGDYYDDERAIDF